MEDSYTSSPDPLANSTRTAPPTDRVTRRKSARLAPAKTPLPLASRTPPRTPSEVAKAQTVQLQNFVFDTPQEQRPFGSSPTKSSIKTENHLSPWRIRVTVEAERDGENDDMNIGYLTEADPEGWKDEASRSPSRGRTRRTRTTTTKVPLKGLESSPPVTKRRGRSKKPETPVRPRNGTPAPKTRGRRRTAGGVSSGGDNSKDPDFLTPKRPRGRPRKGPAVTEGDAGIILDMEHNGDAVEDTATTLATPSIVKAKATTKKAREKKAKSPIKIAVDPDVQADNTSHTGELLDNIQANHASSALADLSVNSMAMLETAEPDDLAPGGDQDFGEQLAGPAEKFSPARKTPVKLKQHGQAIGLDTISTPSNLVRSLAGLVPPESSDVVSSGDLQITDDPGYATASDPHVGELGCVDDSVLESEGFSMVSISSIATAGGYMNDPILQESHRDDIDCDLVESFTDMKLQPPSAHDDSTQRYEREGSPTQEEKWQLERYAVSRQIEMADSNQVITITSDSEPAFSDDEDGCVDGEPFMDPETEYQVYRGQILQEQERQLQDDCQHTSKLETQESKDLSDLFSNEDVKPRRGKIPSPWRADRQVMYSDEAEPGDSPDLLPQPRQGEGRHEDRGVGDDEEDEGKGVDAGDTESPADLSALLGLKSSPAKSPSRNSQSVGKSLRQRLIEKFYWTNQEDFQVDEPAEDRPMEISGRLVLHRPSNFASREDSASKGDGLPVLGLWGVTSLEAQVDKKSVEKRRRRYGKRDEQHEIGGRGSSELKEVHVGKALGPRTYGPSPPSALMSIDDSTDSPVEQRPLMLKLLSARTNDVSPTKEDSVETPSFPDTKSTTTPSDPPASQPPPEDPTKWLKLHWKTLDAFWFASKKARRLNPLAAPTYTTGNLSFHCPGQRSHTLDDDEMSVVREFVAHMEAKNGGVVYEEFGEPKAAKRLYSMIIGEEERRRKGEVYDEEGRWRGYGNSRS